MLKQEIMDSLKDEDISDDAREWIDAMLQYTVPGGKMNRGRTVLHALTRLRGDAGVSEAEAHQAQVLGWCVEFLQGFLLIIDDVQDGSTTRRGQPCWYKFEKNGGPVGVMALNDGILVERFIHTILKTHFKQTPHYVELLELFHDVTLKTELGQLLDMSCDWGQPDLTKEGTTPDFTRFTLAHYERIVKNKTAFYSFYIPVKLAMILAGVEEKQGDGVKAILLDMGSFFQKQDDYLDCFGAPEVIGKIGTDIEDLKCGYLAVQALSKATPEQLEVMKANYGRKDPANVKAVKELYSALKLDEEYKAWEASEATRLRGEIAAKFGEQPLGGVLSDLLDKIAGREK